MGLALIVGMPRPSVQAARSMREVPRVAVDSMAWKGFASSCGNSPLTITRLRRMSTILSTYEMSTGHCSSQARHVVHAQSTSGWITSEMRLTGGRAVDRLRGLAPSLGVNDLLFAPVEVIAQGEREVLGAEDLARAVRGAVVRAAAALGARVEVEERLPREVLDARDADGRCQRVGRLGRGPELLHELLGALGHGLEAARGVRLRVKTFGIAVMTWKCFECGSRFRKRSTSVACVQNPACASRTSAPGRASWNIGAKSEPAGEG